MLRYSYDNINDLYIYDGEGADGSRGFKRVAAGPSNPLYAALLPAAGLALGYNDFKAIEARELISAIAENSPLIRISILATRSSARSKPVSGRTMKGNGCALATFDLRVTPSVALFAR